MLRAKSLKMKIDVCYVYYKTLHPDMKDEELNKKMLEKREEDIELTQADGLYIIFQQGIISSITFRTNE